MTFTLQIYGNDGDGNSLFIRVANFQSSTEVILVLQLKDGRIFTLPGHPDTQVYAETTTFNAGGLSIDCQHPFVSWRVRFNGLLRHGVRSKWSEDAKDEELVAVKFHFFWASKAMPMYSPAEFDVMTAIKLRSNIDCEGYDQFGSMLGEVFVGRGENQEQMEINLPGMRQRRWELKNKCSQIERNEITGVFRDGMVINLITFSGKGEKQ